MASETEPQNSTAAQVTPELIAELDSGKRKLKDLAPDLREKVMEKLENPEAEPEAAETPKEEEKPAGEPEKVTDGEPEKPTEEGKETSKEEPKPFDRKKWRRENQQLFDEANREEQKNKTARERLEKAKAERKKIEDEEKEFKPPEDPWDKDHQTNLAKENQTLKKRLELIEKRLDGKDVEEVETSSRVVAEKRDQEVFGQYHALQHEFRELKTERPFQELNRDYAKWNESLIAASGVREKMPNATQEEIHQAAVKRYESDPEFAKSIPVVPVPEKDWKAFETLLTIHHRKATEGGRAKGIWLDILDEQGILEESMQNGRSKAAAEAAGRTVDAIKKQETTVQPISPSDGSGKGYTQGDRASVAKATLTIKSIRKKQGSGQVVSASDREELNRAVEFMETELAGA